MRPTDFLIPLLLLLCLTGCSLDDLGSQENKRANNLNSHQGPSAPTGGQSYDMMRPSTDAGGPGGGVPDMQLVVRDLGIVQEDMMQVEVDLGKEVDMHCPAPSCEDKCGKQVSVCGTMVDCGSCIDEVRLEELASWVDDYINTVIQETYVSDVTPSFEEVGLKREVREILRRYEASDAGLVAALRHVMLRTRLGHMALGSEQMFSCENIKGAGDANLSKHGVCLVADKDGFLVTFGARENPMGLRPGDTIIAAQGLDGKDLTNYALSLPVCGIGAPSKQARAENAARSFFSALPPKTELTIRSPEGITKQLVVPEASTNPKLWLSCQDALGRVGNYAAKARMRPDGIGVIHVPRFMPLGGFDPNVETQKQSDALEKEILAEFNAIKNARALIWDIRSNPGGANLIGLHIVAGMPGAKPTGIARCATRIPNTTPAEYQYFGPNYDLVPQDRFKFDGPVAILIDGKTFSAGDFFALAASLGTDALLVGSQTAGAYGSFSPSIQLAGSLNLTAKYDPFRCNDLMGTPLETRGVEPDAHVDYDPTDLAQGIDTVEEEAAMMLLTR